MRGGVIWSQFMFHYYKICVRRSKIVENISNSEAWRYIQMSYSEHKKWNRLHDKKKVSSGNCYFTAPKRSYYYKIEPESTFNNYFHLRNWNRFWLRTVYIYVQLYNKKSFAFQTSKFYRVIHCWNIYNRRCVYQKSFVLSFIKLIRIESITFDNLLYDFPRTICYQIIVNWDTEVKNKREIILCWKPYLKGLSPTRFRKVKFIKIAEEVVHWRRRFITK